MCQNWEYAIFLRRSKVLQPTLTRAVATVRPPSAAPASQQNAAGITGAVQPMALTHAARCAPESSCVVHHRPDKTALLHRNSRTLASGSNAVLCRDDLAPAA